MISKRSTPLLLAGFNTLVNVSTISRVDLKGPHAYFWKTGFRNTEEVINRETGIFHQQSAVLEEQRSLL